MGAADRQRDREISVRVRIELVKRWVDMSRVEVYVERGQVEIRGRMAFTGVKEDDKREMPIRLFALEGGVRAVGGVKNVIWRLGNWKKDGAKWLSK